MAARKPGAGPAEAAAAADRLAAIAQTILDAGRYMTLGTADEAGLPWVSPVWYAAAAYRELFWVSSPDARHSRNLAVRPEVAIVVFDSRAPVGSGQGIYMSALAAEVADPDLERSLEVYSSRSVADGARAWTRDDVGPEAPFRLYRAGVTEHFVLDRSDRRTAVTLPGMEGARR